MSKYLLDACALIAFFNEEQGANIVETLFENQEEIFFSNVNVYEVYYGCKNCYCRSSRI